MSDVTKKIAFPKHINLEKWADVGFEWQGRLDVQDFERLQALVQGGSLDLNFRLIPIDGVLWLKFIVSGGVTLDCQRCLEPMTLDLTDDYELALIRNDNELSLIGDADYVLLDELNLSDTKMLPIKDLLEDNLILAMPLSPKHDDCEPLVEESAEETPKRENPFLALAQLKGKLS